MAIMTYVHSYLDQLVEPMFQRDEQGREVFFPMGIGTRGRLVPDAATSRQLHARIRHGWMMFFFGWIPLIGIAATYITNAWAFLAVMAASVAVVWAYALSVARGLEVTSRRMTMRNQAASIQATYSLKRLFWMTVLSVALTAMCAASLYVPAVAAGQPAWFKPTAAIGMVFFAGTTLMWAWHGLTKWRKG